ncbi:MAG: GGDEF domain-containing protein [Rectinema sp.]|nr:GGDEF domain-containing protein [Rectinema sp.]
MIRITRRVFTDLALFMMGFGLLVGVIFPFFVVLLGVPAVVAMQFWFFVVCIIAGIIVGAVNILLARSVVGSRLRTISARMRQISRYIATKTHEEIVQSCDPDQCIVQKDSDDELGECAQSYNELMASLYRSFQKESMIGRFSHILSNRLELDDLASGVLPELMRYCGAAAGAFLVEDNGVFTPRACIGIEQPETLGQREMIRLCAAEGKRLRIDLPADILIDGSLLSARPASIIIEPVIYHEVTLALIVLSFLEPPGTGADTNLDLLVPHIAIALRNALSYDQLQRLAANDSLTGLYNRRFGMARLQEEYGRAVRNNAPIGVCILDLDHFKQVNDTYGHQVGDRVLVHVARIIRSVLREGDIALRYGGEEFMAALPGASMTDAYQIAERIRRQVEDTEFMHGPQRIRLTLSGGVTSWPDFDASSPEALVKRADESLYASKEGGRNRITVL